MRNRKIKRLFVNLIQDTLSKIVKEGIDKKAIAAGINFLEFRFSEADFSSFPKGLMYGIDVFDSWLYDDDKPFDHLKKLDIFESLKQKAKEGYFEKLIEQYLLNNSHASVVVVNPKRGLAAQRTKNWKKSLLPIRHLCLLKQWKRLQQTQNI